MNFRVEKHGQLKFESSQCKSKSSTFLEVFIENEVPNIIRRHSCKFNCTETKFR